MARWYHFRDGKSIGPLTFPQLQKMVTSGELSPEEQVRMESSQKWLPAKIVPGLFRAAAEPAHGIIASSQGNSDERQPTSPTPVTLDSPLEASAFRKRLSEDIPSGVPPAPPLIKQPIDIPERKPAMFSFQRLRTLPKPLLFGLFGGAGGLLGALLFGEMLWALLAPGSPGDQGPILQMAASPSVTVYAGGSNVFWATIERHRLDGPVQLEVVEAPPGVSVLPVTIAPGETETPLKVTVSEIPMRHDHVLQLEARGADGAGAPRAVARVELVIAKRPPLLTLSTAPQVEVYEEGDNRFKVKIARAEYQGPVKVETLELPPGMTAAPIELGNMETEGEMRIEAAASARIGKFKIRVAAKGLPEAGSPEAVHKLNLVVKPKPPALSLSLSPRLVVYPGGKNRFTVKIARGNFDGPVVLTASQLQPGLVIPPVTVPEHLTEVEMDVLADKSSSPGKRDVLITAVGPKEFGVPTASDLLNLNIEPSPPFLGLSVSPKITIPQRGKTRFMIRVARHQFTGPVTLELSNPLKGIVLPKTVLVPADKDEVYVDMEAARDAEAAINRIIILGKGEAEGSHDIIPGITGFQLTVETGKIPKVDILFVLDLTSSMEFAIQGVKDGIKDFVKKLDEFDIDARIGLIGFGDVEDDRLAPFVILTQGKPLTHDYQTFAQSVGNLKAAGGGDIPESSLQALALARKQPFREGATKVIILITDAPPKFHRTIYPRTMFESAADLAMTKIDQFHVVARPKDFQDFYFPLLKKYAGSFNDISNVKGEGAFAALLPIIGAEISKIIVTNNPAPPAPKIDLALTPPPPAAASKPPSASPPPPLKTAQAPPAPLTEEPLPPASATASLPPLDQAVRPTLAAVQSTQAFSTDDSLQLLTALGIWTAVVAGAICLLLIAGQRFYLGQLWLNLPDIGKGLGGGMAAGLLGGITGQIFFQLTAGGTAWTIITRACGWGLLGALIGGGMALFVPNLKWYRGLLGGVLGGVAGALGFMSIHSISGDLTGRLLGATILGFLIGVMIAMAELAFRRFWLEAAFGLHEVRTITLGSVPVGIGGDERLAAVFVRDAPALALRYWLDGDRVLCQDVIHDVLTEVPPGDRLRVGNVLVTVCHSGSVRQTGYTLSMSDGRSVPLDRGMPLTADDLPSLEPQATDGIVALVSLRANDPTTLVLRNRSKQAWIVSEPNGAQTTIEPGRAVEPRSGLVLHFGDMKGEIIAGENKGTASLFRRPCETSTKTST
jgi:hypothetical protein